MSDKIDQGDVAIMLGSFNEFDEIDYRITECATKGVACIVYFYEDKLSEIDQITAYNPEEGIEQALAERRETKMVLITIKVRDGLNEYEYYTYYQTFSEEDYRKEKTITDRQILDEYLWVTVGEEAEEESGEYWADDCIVWVDNVKDMTEQELEVLKKHRIVY